MHKYIVFWKFNPCAENSPIFMNTNRMAYTVCVCNSAVGICRTIRTPERRTKCPTKLVRLKKISGLVNVITCNPQKWPRPGQLVGKTKTNVKHILSLNKLETKQNTQQTAQSGHSKTVENTACGGWHLKMVK